MQARINPDWLAYVYAATDRLFATTLGPELSADAKMYCPVLGGENSEAGYTSLEIAERMGAEGGALRDSIRFFLWVHSLIVMATGSDERTYAAYVELGHRVVVFGRPAGYSLPPHPFLRRALYQLRAAA